MVKLICFLENNADSTSEIRTDRGLILLLVKLVHVDGVLHLLALCH